MTQQHPLDEADLDEFDGESELGDAEDFDGDGEEFDGDAEEFDGDAEEFDDDGPEDADDADADDEDDVPLPADEEEDDDEDVHPSDVEADLEEILRDRIAASDDDEDDEEDDSPGEVKPTLFVAPPRSDEWTCNQCFLIVSVTQFGSRSNPICPSGEEPCESIVRILSG